MEKIYRLLDWLTLEQAVDWLQDLTNMQLTESQLSQLCEARQCNVYMDVECLHGWDGNNEVCGNGIHRLLTPSAIKYAQAYKILDLTFEGPVCLSDGDLDDSSWCTWQARVDFPNRKPCFKPADIQALAAKINGEPRPLNASELNELEIERAARESAEAELLELRKQVGDRTLSNMRAMFVEDLPLRAMTERAEAAEKMVKILDQQLRENAARKIVDDKVFKEMAQHFSAQPNRQLEKPVTGLTFPYATRHLEAMRDAAIKYWSGHDLSKPAPYGIQKSVQNFLAERTGENARKLAELAAVIKPDDLPKS